MKDQDLVRKYFRENANTWIQDAYLNKGHTYSMGEARNRRVLSVLSERFRNEPIQVVDLGCGGGNLCREISAQGYYAVGVDQSPTMIAEARKSLETLAPDQRKRIRFEEKNILNNSLDAGKFNALTSMGVLGYLESDELFFSEANRLLADDGLLLVSARNRLFNMISISDYTVKEIESGGAKELVEEIKEYIQPLPDEDVSKFLKAISQISAQLLNEPIQQSERKDSLSTYSVPIEARQHTPRQLKRVAEKYGFEFKKFFGVHPHLMMAGLNYKMTPGIYNRLSSALEELAHLPSSVIWSSVLIGVFSKKA